MKIKIYPYKAGSASAKALSEAIGGKRLKQEGAWIKTDVFINWGSSNIKREIIWIENYFNNPAFVEIAANKLQAFKELDGTSPIPKFTESLEEASKWLAEGVCKKVVCRTLLNGYSGAGIVIADTPEQLVPAPLYVQYIPKKHEYRVHVGFGKAFFVQQKKKKKEGVENANFQIRNHQNGFIYAHLDVDLPEEIKQKCVDAIIKIGLDFGAVDVIYNEKQNKYYILEINTAPGLQGTTLEKYVQMFKENLK